MTALAPADAMVYRLWFHPADPASSGTWSTDVAAMLLAGFDPGSGSADWPMKSSPDGSAGYWRATRIRELIVQAFRTGEIENVANPADFPRSTPQGYTDWAIRAGIELPADWPLQAETPAARRDRLRRRADELKAENVSDWQKQLAAEEGISTGRIRQLLAEPKDKATIAKPDRSRDETPDNLAWKKPSGSR